MATDIVIGSDFDVKYYGAQDAATGSYLNSGTCTFALYTASGTAVSGGTGTCSYVASSNGDYLGVLESTAVTLTAGSAYYFLITFSQSSYNDVRRLDVVARAPGSVLIDAGFWMRRSGTTLTGADLDTITEICEEVSAALADKCDPIQLTPLTLTREPFDAPAGTYLFLPRPIRSISEIFVRYGANGDPSTLTDADLLNEFTDWYSPVTNKRKKLNVQGVVHRRSSSVWGIEWTRKPGNLAASMDPNRGAVFVSGEFGPASVDPAVRSAAFTVATLMFNMRTVGGMVQSNSWNGGSFSLASAVTAEAAINSPEVLGMLRDAGVLPAHIGGA